MSIRKPSRTTNNNLPPPTTSEAAFDALLASFDDPRPPLPRKPRGEDLEPVAAFLSELYARRDEFLDGDRYRTIGDASEFFTKVAGVSFEGRQDVLGGMRAGEPLELRRQADNAFDANAIAVYYGSLHVGYIKKEIARRIAPNIDGGERYRASITDVTGGGSKNWGINILVHRERTRASSRRMRDEGAPATRDDVRSALIGERHPRDAQVSVLERIDAGRNTLAILGTGRGKSFCFQYPAAVGALERGEKTIVLYPLRALANDQFDALQRRLGPLGLRIFRANGAIDENERADLMDALESGAWDLVCATPEFLQYHIERFRTDESKPHLLVVDEAHHIVDAKHRPAYGKIGDAIRSLGNPQVLALTATADDDVFEKIRTALNIESWVIDPTVRENLHVVDARGVKDKFAYIDERLRGGGKAIVYCMSRAEATKVAEKLRARNGDTVAFYHAGLGSAERAQVETLFREGALATVVATSAFGEGIDLPDVRHVFLYHLDFNFTAFNQQAGRAGRDGGLAEIHLLFGEYDRRINDYIIAKSAPTIATLRALYRAMRGLTTDGTLRMAYSDIADTLAMDMVDGSTVGTAVRIFDDAGIIVVGTDDDGRFLRFIEVKEKLDLTRTARFAEGEADRASFEDFCSLVTTAKPEMLERIINRPIYPARAPLVR